MYIERIFPAFDSGLYDPPAEPQSCPGDGRATGAVLALARQPLGPMQRLGWSLGPANSVARLFWLHREAISADLCNEVPRAGFWWAQLRRQWQRLPDGHPAWVELANRLRGEGAGLLADPRELRRRVAEEVLRDSVLALWGGHRLSGSGLYIARSAIYREVARALEADAHSPWFGSSFRVRTPSSQSYAPILPPEPLDFWLLGRCRFDVKLLLTAAVLAVLGAWAVITYENAERRSQAEAYSRIHAASRHLDPEAALAAARKLREFRPLVGRDARQKLVERIEREAAEWDSLRERDRAVAELKAALTRYDPDDAAQAVRTFRANSRPETQDPREAQIAQLEADLPDLPRRKERDAAYSRLIAAFERRDEPVIAQAASAFEAAQWSPADERTAQVRRLAVNAREWPGLRVRDANFARMRQALSEGDRRAVLLAAERFLEARPFVGEDPRRGWVVEHYTRAFTEWVVERTAPPDDLRTRSERFLALIPAGRREERK